MGIVYTEGNNMKRIKKKQMRKIAIVAAPIVILCAISYASFTARSQANDSVFAYEHYYEREDYTEGDEYNTYNSDISEDDATVIDFDGTAVINDHDSVELDTDPQSITVLVNKELSLPTDYVPADLVVPDVFFNLDYFDEKKQMREEAAEALEELFQAAGTENLSLCAISGYRSYDRQSEIFSKNILSQGIDHTLQYSAKPGNSEHQTGLSIDLSTKSIQYKLIDSFDDTPEGIWLAENAYTYGYIIRYPEDKVDITGYSYEPWHIRYVGKALALYLFDNNLTLEEYYNFEPTIDYANEISYDNLEEFGINADGESTKTNTYIPEVIVEETPVDPEETIEEATTEEATEGEDTGDDSNTDGSTETDEEVVIPEPTAVPTPTVIPAPTAVPTPTPTPIPELDTDDTWTDDQSSVEPSPSMEGFDNSNS